MLTYVGEATNDIFDILPDTGTTYEAAVKCLSEYFSPLGNKDVAIFEFRELAQGNDENITDYYRRLKTKAADCGFTINEDSEIKTQIIHRTRDARLRKKALREEMDLKALLKFGQSLEITDKQVKRLENSANSVNTVKNNRQHVQYPNKYGNNRRGRFSQNTEKQQDSKKTCRNCGGAFPHKNGVQSCPAHGKECHNCGKTGHFAKFCRSAKKSVKNIRKVEQPKNKYLQDSDDDNCFTLSSTSAKSPETQILIRDTNVKVLVDSGTSVNIVHHNIFNQIQKNNPSIHLVPTKAKIRVYGSEDPIELAGQFKTTIQSSTGQHTDATFYATTGQYKCILGYQSSTELGLITLNVNSLTQQGNPTVEKILHRHHNLFQGTGNLKGVEVTLQIDKSITPVAQAPRRIPHHLKKKVNDKLQEMRESGIIERADGATPWLSPLIAIPKKTDNVRLVLDMRVPNIALARRRVQTPTADEILRQMEGAKFFTEVDLSQGYLQLTLSEESRYITAFSTPDDGPHRFTRLIMGASPSGEYFHEIISNLIKDIRRCANISDNISLWSNDKQSAAVPL